jgi:hypothetical protein
VSEETAPPPVFPQYAPPNPETVPFITQKPLMKLINRRLHPRPKSRVSPVKKRVGKRKKDE